MFGIFVFSTDVKWYDKEHPFKKKPQEALSCEDSEIVRLSQNHSNMTAFSIHWTDDMDKEPFDKCFVYFKEKLPSINGDIKKSKKGFIDGEKKYYIRFIVNSEHWFKEILGQS